MANQTDLDLIEEGPRNAVVRLAGVLTESDVNLVSVVPLSMFLNNDVRMTLVGLRVDGIDFTISEPLRGVLYWNGGTPQLISAMAQSEELEYRSIGGLLPDRTRTGYDGSINFRTFGFVPGSTQSYTVLLRLVKLYVS